MNAEDEPGYECCWASTPPRSSHCDRNRRVLVPPCSTSPAPTATSFRYHGHRRCCCCCCQGRCRRHAKKDRRLPSRWNLSYRSTRTAELLHSVYQSHIPLAIVNSMMMMMTTTTTTMMIIITSVRSDLAKGRIAYLSPIADANGFVRCWPPSNTIVLWTHISQPTNGIAICSAVCRHAARRAGLSATAEQLVLTRWKILLREYKSPRKRFCRQHLVTLATPTILRPDSSEFPDGAIL